MTHESIREAFPKTLFDDGHLAVVVAEFEQYNVGVREQRDSFDPAKRHAEVFLYTIKADDPEKFDRYDRVADVYYERESYSMPGRRSQVNWVAWGPQSLAVTRQFAEALLVATEIAEAFADGFSFVTGQ